MFAWTVVKKKTKRGKKQLWQKSDIFLTLYPSGKYSLVSKDKIIESLRI